jgi:hypothetical protein
MKKSLLLILLVGICLVGLMGIFPLPNLKAQDSPKPKSEVLARTTQIISSDNGKDLAEKEVRFRLALQPDDIVNVIADPKVTSISIDSVQLPIIKGRKLMPSELKMVGTPTGIQAVNADFGTYRGVTMTTREVPGTKTLIFIRVPQKLKLEIRNSTSNLVYLSGRVTEPQMFVGKASLPGAHRFETAFLHALAWGSDTELRMKKEGKRTVLQSGQ